MLYQDLQGVVGNAVLPHQQKSLLSRAFQTRWSSHLAPLTLLERASTQFPEKAVSFGMTFCQRKNV